MDLRRLNSIQTAVTKAVQDYARLQIPVDMPPADRREVDRDLASIALSLSIIMMRVTIMKAQMIAKDG